MRKSMMGGRSTTCWSLRLLVLFILLILTENIEVRDDKWEELRPEIAKLQRLRGLSEQMFVRSLLEPPTQRSQDVRHGGRSQRSISREELKQNPMGLQKDLQECQEGFTSCVKKMTPAFQMFLEEIDGQTLDDRLLQAQDISLSYSQRLLIMTDNEKSTQDRAQQEYHMDPNYSKIVSRDCLNDPSCLPEADSYTVVKIFGRLSEDRQTISGLSGSSLAELMLKPSLQVAPVFSFDGNTNSNFQYSFMRIFMVRAVKAVLQINKGNNLVHMIMTKEDSVRSYEIPNIPIDPSTRYDHQQILIMENVAIVKEAALYLHDKHPQSSSVYELDSNRRPKLIHGDSVPLREGSRLVLVGHGVRDSSGEMKLAGFSAEEVAGIVKKTFRIGDKIKTTSLVACEVGADKVFVETLLKELHDTANIKTELHLRNALLQVLHTGEKITQELTTNEIYWYHKDDSTKVVASLDLNGNVVIRNQPGSSREPSFTNEVNILYISEKIHYRFKSFRYNWPKQPQRFINQNVFDRLDQNTLNELEALSWGFFHMNMPRPRTVDVSNLELVNEDYVIGKHVFYDNGESGMNWISDNNELQGILKKCYEVKSGQDVRNVIRRFASYGENEPTYLMVKDWIFAVDPQNLYMFLAGRRLRDNQKKSKNRKLVRKLVEEQLNNEHYQTMRNNIIDPNNELQSKKNYVKYIKGILTGEPTIELKTQGLEAWSTTYFASSVISECSRNFRTFPLILMGLDMVDKKGDAVTLEELNFFFDEHPMARINTWIDPGRRGFNGVATAEGSAKLDNIERPFTEGELTVHLENVLKAEIKQYHLWRKENQDGGVSDFTEIAIKYNIIQKNTNVERDIILDYDYFKYKISEMGEPQASGSLGGFSDGYPTPEDIISATIFENSFKHEAYFSRMKSSFKEQIYSQMKANYGNNLAGMHVKENTPRIQNGVFFCDLVSESGQNVAFRAHLSPENQRSNEKMLSSIRLSINDLESHISLSPSQQSGQTFQHAETAFGIVGLMLGMKGAVTAFEQGDVTDGVVGSLQTAHGVAAMTTATIAKQAITSESRAARVTAKLFRTRAMRGMVAVIPLTGIGFGIYNAEEDFRKGGPQGYIDASFDISMIALDVLELAQPQLTPVLAPLNMALSVIRIVIDDIYTSIEYELKSLPKDAGILDKLVAALRGLGKGFWHFGIRVASFFYDWRYQEIEEGHRLVAEISDYRKYYSVTKLNHGTSAIDFSSGDASWNGGGIQFSLAERGQSELCMDYFVSSDQTMSKKCWNIDTQGSRDIILGLGESHGLEYKTLQRKVLMFIPAGTTRAVSGYVTTPNSRYGTYKGNSESNRFFAIQKAEDRNLIEVLLSYYYKLYGEPGDDIFFLGPQRSYVQGSGGRDTYFIPKNGGKTIINNYDASKSIDTLHFNVDYSRISVTKSGSDVVFMYEGSHTVIIKSWFLGESYRHMNMMSADGVLFEISPTMVSSVRLVARGINMGFKTEGGIADTSKPLLKTVTNIFGSRYDDVLIGNGERNLMDGGGGKDNLSGGEGEDIYTVKDGQQVKVLIDNYSLDREIDLTIIEANLNTFKVRVELDHLILNVFHDNKPIQVTFNHWFHSPAFRHLHVVTKDLKTLTFSDKDSDCKLINSFTKCIILLTLDYSGSPSPVVVDLEKDRSLNQVTEIRGSNFGDTMRGNKEHNVIYSGRGMDTVEGRGGEDWYFITPGQGFTIIENLSPDRKMDFLFLNEKYSNIMCVCEGHTIGVLVKGRTLVHLHHWFLSKKYQHLQIKTSDGVTAGLITDIADCASPVMFPVIIDNRNQKPEPLNPPLHPAIPSNVQIIGDKTCLSEPGEILFCTTADHQAKRNCFTYRHKISRERQFCGFKGKVIVEEGNARKTWVEMYGTSGFDIIVGNSNDNLLDPYIGGALLFGGEGKDKYVVKRGHGMVIIDNFAQDLSPDTVLIDMDFLSGSQIKVNSEQDDLDMVITTGGERLSLDLLNYNTDEQHRHLEFLSSDGVHFRLKTHDSAETLFDIEAFKVTLNQPQGDCRLELNSQKNLSMVKTVQGCPYQTNAILGNALNNVLIGGWKNDILEGDEGDDTMAGGSGDDILVGDSGDDCLYGGNGGDTMMGNSGRDIFIPGPGADVMDGGPGRDTVIYHGDPETGKGVYVNLLIGQGRFGDAEGDVLKDVETVLGTIYSDILVSGHESSLLQGSDGDDILVSTGGDHLVGGEGHDIYMTTFKHGSVFIHNCAKDNAIDVLFLNIDPKSYCEYQQFSDRFHLTFSKENQVLNIHVEGWKSDDDECGHLRLVNRNEEFMMQALIRNCNGETSK